MSPFKSPYLTQIYHSKYVERSSGRYIVDFVNKTSHDKGGERAQMETVQSDTVGFYPRSKLPYCGILQPTPGLHECVHMSV